MNNLLNILFDLSYVCCLIFCLYRYFNHKPSLINLVMTILVSSFILVFIDVLIGYQANILKMIVMILVSFVIVCILNHKYQFYYMFYVSTFYILYIVFLSFMKYAIGSFLLFIIIGILLYVLMICVFKGLDYFHIIPSLSRVKEHYFFLSLINLIALSIYEILYRWLIHMNIMNLSIQGLLMFVIVLWLLLLYGVNHIFVVNEMKTKSLYITSIYKSIEQYQKQYQQDEEKIRKLKHDMQNHFLIIQKLKDPKQIQEYVQKVSNDLETIHYNEDQISGNVYIDAIIHAKILEYPQVHIHYDFSIRDLEVDMIDICPLIFNLIDNACEAAQKVNGDVNIQMIYNQPHLRIEVQNICQENPSFVSNKGQGHGYGMKIMKDIVKKYNGSIQYESSSQKVITKVILTI